jgi:hypothetical protein
MNDISSNSEQNKNIHNRKVPDLGRRWLIAATQGTDSGSKIPIEA